MLDNNTEALFELKKFKYPLIGLVDTDMEPQNFLYKFMGNNDAVETIEFFFDFLKEAAKEGRLKEQQVFYKAFLHKLYEKWGEDGKKIPVEEEISLQFTPTPPKARNKSRHYYSRRN